ncbi:MAG: hypothetical protein KDM64_04045, partial [Verrucomicrobiae bacterium]|nr:hypothetical protein [Verrucomicrobiae bacterium]
MFTIPITNGRRPDKEMGRPRAFKVGDKSVCWVGPERFSIAKWKKKLASEMRNGSNTVFSEEDETLQRSTRHET